MLQRECRDTTVCNLVRVCPLTSADAQVYPYHRLNSGLSGSLDH